VTARLEFPRGKLAEGALYQVKPGRRGGHEMKPHSRVLFELALDLGMLVGGVVVEDDVDLQLDVHALLDWHMKRRNS
jgi:hypothetical protein